MSKTTTQTVRAASRSLKALAAAKLVQISTTMTGTSVEVFIDGVGLPEGTDRVNLAIGGHKLRIRVKGDTGKTGKTDLLVGGVVIGSASATVIVDGRAWSADTPFVVPA